MNSIPTLRSSKSLEQKNTSVPRNQKRKSGSWKEKHKKKKLVSWTDACQREGSGKRERFILEAEGI
jgi:hypothetical protein